MYQSKEVAALGPWTSPIRASCKECLTRHSSDSPCRTPTITSRLASEVVRLKNSRPCYVLHVDGSDLPEPGKKTAQRRWRCGNSQLELSIWWVFSVLCFREGNSYLPPRFFWKLESNLHNISIYIYSCTERWTSVLVRKCKCKVIFTVYIHVLHKKNINIYIYIYIHTYACIHTKYNINISYIYIYVFANILIHKYTHINIYDIFNIYLYSCMNTKYIYI